MSDTAISDDNAESDTAERNVHMLGVEDSLPLTHCPHCKRDVKPKGKGLCPGCGRMLKRSFVARKHPVNKLRRDQILSRLLADYAPRTTVLLAAAQHLAGVLEQLEVLKPGSSEHQRLVLLSQTLATTLEESRVPVPDLDDLSPKELVEKARQLLSLACEMAEAEPQTPPPQPVVPRDSPIVVLSDERPASEPEPFTPPICSHCRRSPDACAGLKLTDLASWRVLHARHPDEIQRRREYNTAVMLHQVGKPSP